MDEVRDFLNETGLGQYAEKFEEHGWDDIDIVLSMTEHDIKSCIDKPGHVKKLLVKLQKTIQETSQTANTKDDTLSEGSASKTEDESHEQAVATLNESQIQQTSDSQVIDEILYTRTPTTLDMRTVYGVRKLTIAKHLHQAPKPSRKGQTKPILSHHEKRHKNLHIKTKALEEAHAILEDRHWVVIVGNPGEGKTWMGHQLVFDYRNVGYESVIITNADEWTKNVRYSKSCKQIVFIDDIFGSINLNDRKVSDWVSVFEDAEALVEEEKHNLIVVCTSRKIIYEEVKPKLSKYKFVEGMRLIDLSYLHKLTPNEKAEFLQKYQKWYNVPSEKMINITEKAIVAHSKTVHGFPHCVEMFCTNKNLQEASIGFLANPIEFLEKEMNNMYVSESNRFCTLVAVLISQNLQKPIRLGDISKDLLATAADCCCLDSFGAGAFRRCIDRITDIYIEQDYQGVIVLKHPSYAEVVSLIIAKKNPHSALDILDIDFLMKRIRCCNSERPTAKKVTLHPTCSEKLVIRLTESMLSNFYQLFGHEAFSCRAFLEVWLNYLSCTMSEHKQPLLVRVMKTPYLDFFRNEYPILHYIPSSTLDFLIPKLTSCTLLQGYWNTEQGIQHSSQALIRATIENCSTNALGCLIDIGAKTSIYEERSIGLFKHSLLHTAVENGNLTNTQYLVSRGVCPCIMNEKDNLLVVANKLEVDKPERSKLITYIEQVVAAHSCELLSIERGSAVSLCHLFAERYDDYNKRKLEKEYCLNTEKLTKPDLHIVISEESLDVEKVRKSLEAGADTELQEGNCGEEDADILMCGQNVFPLGQYSSVEEVTEFCNNATCWPDLMMAFEFGFINFDKLLNLLITKQLLAYLLKDLLSERIESCGDLKKHKRNACRDFNCLNRLRYDDKDILEFSQNGLCLSWFQGSDLYVSKVVEIAARQGVDIHKTFTQIDQTDFFEMELARRGFFITLCFVLENIPDRRWAQDLRNIQEMVQIAIETEKSLDDSLLNMLLQEEQFRKCLVEMAPYVVSKCIEQFPIKVACARHIFKHINHVLFTDTNENLLQIAILALDRYSENADKYAKVIDEPYYEDDTNDLDVDTNDGFDTDNENCVNSPVILQLNRSFERLLDILQENDMLTDRQDGNGKTSLMVLLQLNSVEQHQSIVAKLLNLAKGLHEQDDEGRNILHYLAMAKLSVGFKQKMIKVALQKGAQLNCDKRGLSPLALLLPEHATQTIILDLCVTGDNAILLPDVVVWFLWTPERNRQRQMGSNDKLLKMIELINTDYINARDAKGVTLMAHACRALDIDLLKHLLQKGGNPNEVDITNQSSLHKLFCSEWLLSCNLMRKQLFDSSLTEIKMDLEICALNECGVSFDHRRLLHVNNDALDCDTHHNLLHLVNGALMILYELLENGANPNQMDIMGRSPLHLCAGAFMPDAFVCPAMKMLIAYGADVNTKDFKGVTPLMLCAQYVYNKFHRISILIDAGANVMSKDSSGNGLPEHSNIGDCRRSLVRHILEKQLVNDE